MSSNSCVFGLSPHTDKIGPFQLKNIISISGRSLNWHPFIRPLPTSRSSRARAPSLPAASCCRTARPRATVQRRGRTGRTAAAGWRSATTAKPLPPENDHSAVAQAAPTLPSSHSLLGHATFCQLVTSLHSTLPTGNHKAIVEKALAFCIRYERWSLAKSWVGDFVSRMDLHKIVRVYL